MSATILLWQKQMKKALVHPEEIVGMLIQPVLWVILFGVGMIWYIWVNARQCQAWHCLTPFQRRLSSARAYLNSRPYPQCVQHSPQYAPPYIASHPSRFRQYGAMTRRNRWQVKVFGKLLL